MEISSREVITTSFGFRYHRRTKVVMQVRVMTPFDIIDVPVDVKFGDRRRRVRIWQRDLKIFNPATSII